MELSLSKLHKILNRQGLTPKEHYVYNKYYRIIKVSSITTYENMIIYIPKSVSFRHSSEDKVYYRHIEKIQINLSKNLSDDIGSTQSKYYQDLYTDLQIDCLDDANTNETELKNNYNHNIVLHKLDKQDNQFINTIFKQLLRINETVKFLSYKLCIQTSNYIFLPNEKNTIETYIIKDTEKDFKKSLYVSITQPSLIGIESPATITHNIKEIQRGVRTLLEKNRSIHYQKFLNLFDRGIYDIKIILYMIGCISEDKAQP